MGEKRTAATLTTLLARNLYCLSPTRYPPGFWLSTLVALIIPPGQSVQDGVVGKDICTAFAVRLGLLSRHRRR